MIVDSVSVELYLRVFVVHPKIASVSNKEKDEINVPMALSVFRDGFQINQNRQALYSGQSG